MQLLILAGLLDSQVTGTSLKLNKVDKPAQGDEGKKTACGATTAGDAGASLAAGVDAALFLDEDVDLPSDDDD